jgi:hypothetical protein
LQVGRSRRWVVGCGPHRAGSSRHSERH